MSVKIKNLYAQPLASRDVLVYFDIEDVAEDPTEFKFFVLRSISTIDNWAVIAELTDQQQHVDTFRDVDASVFKPGNIHVYYKVKAVNTSTDEEWSSDPILSSRLESDAIAGTLSYKYNLVLSKKSGVDAMYFVARKHGFRCPICWNPTMKSSMKSNCKACFGTGYYQGYYTPVFTKIQFSKEVVDKSNISGLSDNDTPISLVMGNYPMSGVKDIIFEIKRNRVMRVVRSSYMDHVGNVYAQKVVAVNVPSDNEISRFVAKKYMELAA